MKDLKESLIHSKAGTNLQRSYFSSENAGIDGTRSIRETTIMPGVSILTAFLNEESNLPLLAARVTEALKLSGMEYDIVLIDDHSSDGSPAFARAWAARSQRPICSPLAQLWLACCVFRRTVQVRRGDCAILLAADLQDPPEMIPDLLEQWKSGHDVVWATRSERRGESLATRAFARIYYWLMRTFALPDMPEKGADFLLMDRKVIDAYNAIPEKNTSFLAMILWLGFRQTSIEYVKQARHSGKSKWNLSKKIKLLIDSMVSFSYAPIRFMSLLGLLMAIGGFVYALVVIVGRLTGWVAAGTGFAALMTVLLVGQGSILLMLGILGEYLWRTFDELRGRPRYIIEEIVSSKKEFTKPLLEETRT